MSMSTSDSVLTKGTIKVRSAQLSVMPRSVLRSALGSLGSALAAAELAQRSTPCAVPVWRLRNAPPDDFGCSEGCDFAHSCFACLINDSLCSHSFFSTAILSRADSDSWWYAP
jgi:hypothetical protein